MAEVKKGLINPLVPISGVAKAVGQGGRTYAHWQNRRQWRLDALLLTNQAIDAPVLIKLNVKPMQ